jgi:hypothetical protein
VFTTKVVRNAGGGTEKRRVGAGIVAGMIVGAQKTEETREKERRTKMADTPKYAKCACGSVMVPGGHCIPDMIHLVDQEDLKKESYLKRLPYVGELDLPNCPDCNCGNGKIHHMDCDWEKCPKCGGQLLTCDCWDYYINSAAMEGAKDVNQESLVNGEAPK